MPLRTTRYLPLLLALLAFAGCRDAKIVTYRVPKEAPPPAAANAASANPHAGLGIPAPGSGDASAPANMASTPVPTAEGGDLRWTAPANWQSRPGSAMRKATYILTGASAAEQAELAVTAFPGDVGGNLANVNRWRNQLQLTPIDATALAADLIHLDVGDLHIDYIDILGPDAPDRKRVLGAIVPFNGATWFFKLTGPDALVAARKTEFVAFLQTLKTP